MKQELKKQIERQLKVSQKTLAIKARVYNQLRTDLYKKDFDKVTQKEKNDLFEKWFNLNHEAHWELNNYKNKRKQKTKIQELRIQKLKS